MTTRISRTDRLVAALASIQLGVLVMVALAVACIAATFYEAGQGTAAAQREFYQTRWFSGLLALLGLNVLLSMLKRYPWNRHHTGFVLAHLGILLILGGSLLSLHAGLDGRLAIYEGETSNRVSLDRPALQVTLPRHVLQALLPLDAGTTGLPRLLPLSGSPFRVVVEDYAPHVSVRETWVEGDGPNPALRFRLSGAFGEQEGWLVANDPQQSASAFGPVPLRLLPSLPGRVEASENDHNELALAVLPDGSVGYRLTATRRPGRTGALRPGEALATPWMGASFSVEQVLLHATTRRTIAPAPVPAEETRRLPAVRVQLADASNRSAAEWVPWGETRAIPFGQELARVSYDSMESPLPFRLALLHFDAEKYPGSERPARYESRVRVEDPQLGSSERLISMNHPLHYRGYIFFQSSFVEGDPALSIFSVSRAPGLPVVYLGTALLSLGVLWMFYLKPWLARRQGARALAARAG